MTWLRTALVAASCAVTAWCLWPLATPPPVAVLEAAGAEPLRHPDFARIDSVLVSRAPGWGMDLRTRVAEAIAEEAERAGFDPFLVLALIEVESFYQQDAATEVGAHGLMQLTPATVDWVSRHEGLRLGRAELDADPSLNVRLGVRYLRFLRELFRGRLDLALMAYNAGPNRVLASLKGGGTEAFQGYVFAVRRQYAGLKRALGEPGDWALASREAAGDTAGR